MDYAFEAEHPCLSLALGSVLRNQNLDSIHAGATAVSHIGNAIETPRSAPSPELAAIMDCLRAIR